MGEDQRERAEAAFREALRRAPRNARYALRLAEFHRREGDLSAAQRYYQQAVDADPRDGAALERTIDAYLAGGKTEIARRQYEQACASGRVPDVTLRRIGMAIRFFNDPLSPAHLDAMRRHFDAYPEDKYTGLKLATALYHAREFAEAHDVMERLVAAAPDDEEVLMGMAQSCAQMLDFACVIERLEALHARFPGRESLTTALANAYRHDFQPEEQRKILRAALDAAADAEQRWKLRAQLIESHVEFGEFDRALGLLDEWADEPSAGENIRRERIRIMLIAERYAEAASLARALLDEDPEDANRRMLFVQTARLAGDVDVAEHHLRRWRQDEPDSLEWLHGLVNVLLEQDRAAEALDLVAGFAAATAPAEIDLRGVQAQCEADLGETDEAVARLEQLLGSEMVERNPEVALEIQAQLVDILLNAKRFDEAVTRAQAWSEETKGVDPQRYFASLELLRQAYLMAGREAEYEALMERLLEFQPNHPNLNNDLGYSWIDAGRNLERATAMIKRAVAAQPMQAAYLDSLGWAYYKAGDFAAARVPLERAVRLWAGRDPVLMDHAGDAAYRAGDAAAAERQWRAALALLDEPREDSMLTDRAALKQSLTGKLHALERGAAPTVAPTAAEQNEDAES